jgi:tetratricopeptide (TPR) repeat protein
MANQEAVLRDNTFNIVDGDQYLMMNNNAQAGSSSLSTQAPTSLSFNDAPLGLSTYFTGRDKELAEIGRILDIVHDDMPARCAIHGMYGVGKTQLALQFAKLSFIQQRHNIIFWISATTIEKLNHGFVHILHLVDHAYQFHTDDNIRLTAARRWLEETSLVKWLLVLDNVNPSTLSFIREHLPHKNKHGSILFTTRTDHVAAALACSAGRQEIIELELFDLPDAVNLFLTESYWDAIESDPSDASKAEEVVKHLGRLPLAVSHAAAYMKQSRRHMDDMLLLLESNHKIQVRFDVIISCIQSHVLFTLKMLSWENNLSAYEEKSVAAMFKTQLDDLDGHCPDAMNLLKVLSYLDPECIPLKMITQGAEVMSSLPSATSRRPKFLSLLLHKIKKQRRESSLVPSQSERLLALIQSSVDLHDTIMQLQNRSLVQHQRGTDGSVLRIHDLTNMMVHDNTRRSGEEFEWLEFAAALACGAFQHVEDPTSYKCWAECEMFLPHFQLLTMRNEIHGNQNLSVMTANMGIAGYLWSCGRYSEAANLYKKVLAVMEEKLGAKHLDTLTTMDNLALVYESQGCYNKAETLCKQVLPVREEKLGAGHPSTLLTTHNLANVYQSQGRYNKAEVLYKQVLAVWEEKFEAKHPSTLSTRSNLANVYQSQGRYNEAEVLFKQVLAVQEEKLGAENLSTLLTTNNLASVYESQRRYNEAEVLYKQVLAVWEEKPGAEHPSTLSTTSNLANVYQSQGRYNEAEVLYKNVLAVQEEKLGAAHPSTLLTTNNLAVVYQCQERCDEAEVLYKNVLAVWEKKFGAEHPSTLSTTNNLANVYLSQGRYNEAEILYKQLLPVQKEKLGIGHPDTLRTRKDLAQLYQAQGRHDEAKAQHEAILASTGSARNTG